MIAKKIEILSEYAEECIVYISDGMYECAAFCQPCHLEEGDEINEPLHTFNCYTPTISKLQEIGIRRLENSFRHEACGQVVDIESCLVRVGSLLIFLDNSLPGNTALGDYISFVCDRVDIW
jgi:hypothetical protein